MTSSAVARSRCSPPSTSSPVVTRRIVGQCYHWQRAVEFRGFLATFDRAVPADLGIDLVRQTPRIDTCANPSDV